MLIDKIRDFVSEKVVSGGNEDDLYIRGLWAVDCLFQPKNERLFDIKFLVAQTCGQGSAYSTRNYDPNDLRKLMGKNYAPGLIDDLALEVAILDSIYAKFQSEPQLFFDLTGNTNCKSKHRAEIIVNEAVRCIERNAIQKPKIVNVGVVGNIIKLLLERGFDVSGCDFDDAIVDTEMFGKAPIYHGSKSLDVIARSDVAIVTGMTLTTDTIDDILRVCRENNVVLIIFAETGSNLSDFYVSEGVDVFIGEPFPFYIFEGTSRIKIFRKQ